MFHSGGGRGLVSLVLSMFMEKAILVSFFFRLCSGLLESFLAGP